MPEIKSGINQELLKPDYKVEALALLERLRETEKDFEGVHLILSRLDLPENRDLLANAINIKKQSENDLGNHIESDDFNGCHSMEFGSAKVRKEYGFNMFPSTLIVPTEQWSTYYSIENGKKKIVSATLDEGEMQEFNREAFEKIKEGIESGIIKKGSGFARKVHDRSFNYANSMSAGGIRIKGEGMPSPFSKTGISFLSESEVAVSGFHEDFHRAFEIYSPWNFEIDTDNLTDVEYKIYLQSIIEHRILDEVNAYRMNVSSGEVDWLESKGESSPVSQTLIDFYLPSFQDAKEFGVEITEDKVNEVCRSMDYLNKTLHLSQSAISHILLNCKSLDDLISWQKITEEDIKELI